MCSIKLFEVYKGKYIGDVFGYDDKGPLIDKCVLRIELYNFGFTSYAENTSSERVLSYNGLLGLVDIIGCKMFYDIRTVEDFFKITKIK